MAAARVRPRVKVCGMRSTANVSAAADAGADAVGVITDVPVDTHREVSVDRAREVVASAPPFLATTLVTMPDSPDEAADLVARVGADHLQVHGMTDPAELGRVRAATPARLVAAVDAGDDLASLDGHADALLVDSADDTGAGGTGETHDWERAAALVERLDTPVVLAGGLTPGNVGRAVQTVRPYGVDVASGVERAEQIDPERVRAFVTAAREEVPA
ncbi:MAG: phosphoribosylanthranilate isomerase [Haloferacaceae archaeon]